VIIQGGGNSALEKNDNDKTTSDSTAIVAAINPSDPPPGSLVQSTALSIDGDQNGNTLTDTTATTLSYYFGANGADTLTGSSGSDVLNGGGGIDTLNGGAGNDLLVYDNASIDVINGGGDFDILRVDDGALQLSQAGSSLDSNTLNSTNNVLVSLSNKAISNIEAILITEEAGASTLGTDPNDDVGTTLRLTAADVLDYTDADHELWILGSPGDVVDLGPASDWKDTDNTTPGVQGTPWSGTDGQMFTVYQSQGGALVYVENEVRAQFTP
jgi:hypothetical protein